VKAVCFWLCCRSIGFGRPLEVPDKTKIRYPNCAHIVRTAYFIWYRLERGGVERGDVFEKGKYRGRFNLILQFLILFV